MTKPAKKLPPRLAAQAKHKAKASVKPKNLDGLTRTRSPAAGRLCGARHDASW